MLLAALLLAPALLASGPVRAGLFGGKRGDPVQPPPTASPAPPAEAPAAPAEPARPAPPLFPEGLPVSLQRLPEGLANLSAQGCEGCHYQVTDDWAQSRHRQARVSPTFSAAVEAAGEAPVCLNCHLPLANQQPLLLVEYLGGPLSTATTTPNPSWDATLAQEGVTCAACHVREGEVLGTRAASGGPHAVVASPELRSPEACATCHQLTWPGADAPFYDTYGEWSRSAYAEAGVRCQDCHMPASGGLVTASRAPTHADHHFDAARGRGLSVLVRFSPEDVVRGQALDVSLRVQNTGAGHAVPTGSPFSGLELLVRVVDREGEVVGAPWVHRFGRVVEAEPPYRVTADTRLPAGAEITLPARIELPQKGKGGPGALVVALRRVDAAGVASEEFDVQHLPLTVY